MSKYNDNDYCFVHTMRGFELEQKKIFEKQLKWNREAMRKRRNG